MTETSAPPPRLSVAMAVHNGMPFIEESVRSILAQSFSEFEFVIGDDGSSDGTTEVLRRLAAEDARIRLLRREERSGLAGSANWVVGETRAPLVAIMHADDRSYPERLARQLAAIEAAPDAQLVGTLCDGLDRKGRIVRSGDFWRLTRRSPFAPFCHSGILFRRAAFDAVGGYRAEAEYWEDLDLYLRLAERGRILVVPEVLSSVRFTAMSARLTNRADRVDEALDLMYRSVADYVSGGAYPARFPPRSGPGAKLVAETYIGRGSTQLWSGVSPGLLGRMWRRADLGLDAASLRVVIWAVWAEIAPRSLRGLLRLLMAVRRSALAPEMAGRQAVEWDPKRARRAAAAQPGRGEDEVARERRAA